MVEPGTDDLPILKKKDTTDDLEGLPVLKKKVETVTPSAQSTIPSDQPLSNAPTTTVAPLTDPNSELPTYTAPKLGSLPPLVSGTSESVVSTSVPYAPASFKPKEVKDHFNTVQGMDKMKALKDKTMYMFDGNPLFDINSNPNAAKNREIYFNHFKSLGYTENDINHLKNFGNQIDYNKQLLAENSQKLNANPNDVEASYNTGVALLGLGKYDDAISMFNTTLGRLKPEQESDGTGMIQQGQLSMNTKYQQTGAVNPTNSLYGIGSALSEKGDYTQAEEYYNQALKADPSNSRAQQGLAYVKYRLGDKEGAKAAAKEAIKIQKQELPFEKMGAQIEAEAQDEREQQALSERTKGIADMLENFAKGDPEGKMGSLGYMTPWGFVGHTGKNILTGIAEGLEKANKGVAQVLLSNSLEEAGGGALKTASGLTSAAFSAIPQVQLFNNAVMPIQEAAAAAPENKALQVAAGITEVPFQLASKIAEWTGNKPEEGSAGEDFLHLVDALVPVVAHKAGTNAVENFKSIKDLQDIAKKVSEGKASPEEVSALQEFSDYAKTLKMDDLKQYAIDIGKERMAPFAAGKVSEKVATLTDKLVDLNKAIENPDTNPTLKQQYEEAIQEIHKEINEINKTETDQNVASAEMQVKISEFDDQIAQYNGELEKAETPAEKEIIQNNINKLQAEKDTMVSEADADRLYKTDIEAISDPGSKLFYEKAIEISDNPQAMDRVKQSIAKAVEAGELDPMEAEEQLKSLSDRVQIDSAIPKKIVDPESRIKAADLIEKRQEIKESVQGLDKTLAAEEIQRANAKVEKIDEQLTEIKTQANEKAKEEKAGEKTDVLDPEQEKRHTVWKRIVGEIQDEGLRNDLEEYDLSYVVKKEALTEAKAQEVLDAAVKSDRLQEVETLIVDRDNEMDVITRGVLSAMLGKHYFDMAEKATDPKVREDYLDKFYTYTDKAANLSTLGGQAGNQIGKTIKKMYVNNPETVVSQVKRKFDQKNKKVLEENKQDIRNTYEAVKHILETPEGQQAITEEITKRSERLFGKETQQKISTFFDSAKLKDGTYSSVIPPPVINGAIEIMKQSALLGAKGAKIIAAGIEHINEKMKGEKWDEDAFKNEWEGKLKESGIKFGKGLTPEQRLKMKEKSLEKLLEFIKNPQDYIDKLEERRKKIAETEEQKPEELKAVEAEIEEAKSTLNKLKSAIQAPGDKMNKIKELDEFIKDPQKYIDQLEAKKKERLEREDAKTPQVKALDAEIKEKRKILDDIINPPKIKVSPKEEQSILDAIEKKAKRLNETNRNKFLKEIVHVVENEGGLTEQRFQDLYAEALGLETMKPELSEKIIGLSKTINAADAAKKKVSSIYDEMIEEQNENGTVSDELKTKLKEASDELKIMAREADKAESELSSTLRDKKDFADTFISLMQLNVLTPISLFRNIVGTMPDVLLIRPASNFIAGGLDFLQSKAGEVDKLSKHFDSDRKTAPIARTKGAWLALPDAYRNMITSIITSETPNRAGNRNMFNKMEPVKAAERIWDSMQGKSKMNASEWVSSVLESTVGFPAAAIGRGLIGPDTFFRTVSEQAKLYELAAVKGLKGIEIEKFVKNPDAESLEAAEKYADVVTYQGDNKVSKGLASLKRSFKEGDEESGKLVQATKATARILAATQALFVKTPTNVLISSVKIAFPEVSMATGIYEWSKGNKEQATRDFALAMTGTVIRLAVSDMSKKGIINPATDYDDKKRGLEDNEGKHGGQVNYSRMMRYLTLQDNGERESDVWVDYKWLGPIGLIFGAQSALAQEERSSEEEMSYPERVGKGAAYSLGYVSELPYIQSMGMIADAIKDPERNFNSWAAGTVGTLASAVYPNTASSASKASTEDSKKIYDKDLVTYIKNKFKYQMFMGDSLPSKVNLWGEKLSAAPDGSDPYTWYLLNFYKDRDPEENSMSYKLQDLHEHILESTNDKKMADKIVPDPPGQKIQINKEAVALNAEEYEDLQVLVGQRRKELVKAYFASDEYQSDNDVEKIDKLTDIYRDASKDGKEMLISGSDRLTEINNETGVNPVSGNHRKKKPAREGRPKRNTR